MAKKNKTPSTVLITALIVVGVIQCVAMHYGINGTFRSLVALIIAGIAGLAYPTPNVMKGG